MKKKYFFSLLVSTIVLSLASCKKDPVPVVISEPKVTTQDIDLNQVTDAKAVIAFSITADGNSPIKAFGYCWSRTTQTPTIDDVNSHVYDAGAKQSPISLNSNLDNLNPYDTYYVRAYATNEAGKTGYGDTKTFKTLRGTFTDNDGNLYHTITIGNQVWMQENWKSPLMGKTGSAISKVTDNATWSTTSLPAYCWYANDPTNETKTIYGGLYNWYAITHPDFAPDGWHVPSDNDFTKLATYLGGVDVAGGKLKDTKLTTDNGTWVTPNTGASNESGFTALASGFRGNDGSFNALGAVAYFWVGEYVSARAGQLTNTGSNLSILLSTNRQGNSVRLIRDTPANN
jgi:uncharacterized protein (TIGR02145 family)